jgi:hexokinase
MQITELTQIRDNFLSEMQLATKGGKTSLPFIKHQLSETSMAKEGDTFQVLIIGGTVFQKALFKVTDGTAEFTDRGQGNIPAFQNKETFMQFVEEQLYPETHIVAVNFAYALNPIFREGRLDGELVWGSKEHLFNGLIGLNIGQEIEKHFKNKFSRDLQVAVANDTICLLLSGLREYNWDTIASGIVGTGMNFAMFMDHKTAINLESAEFDKFETAESVKVIDANSATPGSALLEKEAAGAYIYMKYNIEAKEKGIETEELKATEELDRVIQNEAHPGNALATAILDRAAALVAIQISSIMEYHQKSMIFSMTGSLFWKGYNFRELVDKYVHQLSPSYVAEFVRTENAELYGAAKLVT